MKISVLLGLLYGCLPMAKTPTKNAIQLTPANLTAIQDGTPIATLYGVPGRPQGTVSFVFANGLTLAGDAIMHQDENDTMSIWGQAPQSVSNTGTIEMIAINEQEKMVCSGTVSPGATNLTCNLSDGAVYRDDYTAPLPPQKMSAAPSEEEPLK